MVNNHIYRKSTWQQSGVTCIKIQKDIRFSTQYYFFQHFNIKMFAHAAKIEFYSEHLYSHQLYFAINILLCLLYSISIHLSIPLYMSNFWFCKVVFQKTNMVLFLFLTWQSKIKLLKQNKLQCFLIQSIKVSIKNSTRDYKTCFINTLLYMRCGPLT